MQPRKLDVLFAKYAYAGNGGCQSMHPLLCDWLVTTTVNIQNDPRIGRCFHATYSDTPITMTRNKTIEDAKRQGVDVLVMLDNDNVPDFQSRSGKRFFESSFDYLYKNYDRGPSVIMAPYCGPPPQECVYIFEWKDYESDTADPKFKLEMISRSDALRWEGIGNCAAGPTGVSMWDMRAFDLMTKPYFDYEWSDESASQKASTEDVFATRNFSMAGLEKLGFNPLFVNWDCWAGHAKPKIVPRPSPFGAEQVHKSLRNAVTDHNQNGSKSIQMASPETVRIEYRDEQEEMAIQESCTQ